MSRWSCHRYSNIQNDKLAYQILREKMKELRLLDTGMMTATQNIALDDILLQLRNDDKIPDTLRLLQFKPHAVLVGFHQSIEQEVRVDFCQQKDIDINRRITGG